MFDERLVFYGLTIFLIVSCIKMLFEVDAETSIPKWANGKIVNGAILGLNSIIFFIIILSMVISDFPMIANTASSTRTGIVVSCTRRGTNVSPGKWRVNKYDFTIKDSATGDEIDFEDARVQELSVGMQVEVRQFQTKSLDSVVEKINGVTTEYFKQTFCESNTEKIGVFLGLLIIALIVMGKISYDYFRQSGRKKGTAWYVVSIIGSIFYILFSWFGMQEIKGNIYAEIGIGIQICLEIFFVGGIFLEREVKEEKTTEKILPYEVCEEITETDIESSNIPTFKQLSQSVSEKYCEYKYKERKKRMKSRLIMLELIYICAFDTVMEEWETYYRLNIIGILVVAAIITPILVPKLFERKNQELKASMSCVGEYVVVKERFYEKIKLRCSDGRIIRYQMKTDDKDELDNGEDAVIVYFPESEQIYLERLKEWNKLFL